MTDTEYVAQQLAGVGECEEKLVADAQARYRAQHEAIDTIEQSPKPKSSITQPAEPLRKPDYSITELAAMRGISRKRVLRDLQNAGVIGKGRKKNRVPVSMLLARAPEFWSEILANLKEGSPSAMGPLDALTPAQLMREFMTPRESYSINFLSSVTSVSPQKLRRRLAAAGVLDVRSKGVKGPSHKIARSRIEWGMRDLWFQIRLAILERIRRGTCPCGRPYKGIRLCLCPERRAVDKAWLDRPGPRDVRVLLRSMGRSSSPTEVEARHQQRLEALAKGNAAKKAKSALVKGHYGVRRVDGRNGPYIVAVKCKHCAYAADPCADPDGDHLGGAYHSNRGGLGARRRYNRARARVVKHLLEKHREALGSPAKVGRLDSAMQD